MKMKTWQEDLVKGSALGTGILPGVSVGTVGFIVDIYDRLIDSLAGLRSKATFKKSLLALIPIGFSCLLFTFLFLFFWRRIGCVYVPIITVAVLVGFIIGGLPVMTKELRGEKLHASDFARIIAGFVIAAGIGLVSFFAAADIIKLDTDFYEEFFNPFGSPWIYLVVFGVGLLSAVACLIPGISGSMIMFIFNLFNPFVTIFISGRNAAKEILPFQASIFESQENLFARLLIVAVFLVAMLIGFVAVSVAMRGLLNKHRRGTFGCVVGFVLGSIVSMFFNNEMYSFYTDPAVNQWWQFVIGAVLGIGMACLTYYLVKRAMARKEREVSESQSE